MATRALNQARIPEAYQQILARVSRGETLAEVVGVAPAQLDAIYAQAYAALAVGRLGEARQLLASLVTLEPNRSRSWAALGIVLDRLGDAREASSFLAIAAAIEDSAPLWLRAAECAARAGNSANARRAAEHAMSGKGSTELVRQRARLVMEEVDHG